MRCRPERWPGIVLSTDTVAPGQAFDALFNCQPGAPIEYSFQGASSTINCGGSGIARPTAGTGRARRVRGLGVFLRRCASATLVVVAPGEPTLVLSGAFSLEPAGRVQHHPARQGLTARRRVQRRADDRSVSGRPERSDGGLFAYLGPSEPGIYPVTATLDANTVLDGAIYVAGEASTPIPVPIPALPNLALPAPPACSSSPQRPPSDSARRSSSGPVAVEPRSRLAEHERLPSTTRQAPQAAASTNQASAGRGPGLLRIARVPLTLACQRQVNGAPPRAAGPCR